MSKKRLDAWRASVVQRAKLDRHRLPQIPDLRITQQLEYDNRQSRRAAIAAAQRFAIF
jgi:hypothetical protein